MSKLGRDDAGGWGELSAPNAAYLWDLYDQYLESPGSVDPEIGALFERWGPPDPARAPGAAPGAALAAAPEKIAAAATLATAVRAYGCRAARLDPLGSEPPGDMELLPEFHRLTQEDLDALPASIVAVPSTAGARTAGEAIAFLRSVYQGTTGYEFEHLSDEDERAWLRSAVEEGWFRPPRDPIDERRLLERLTEVGAFERFLHMAFPGQTRFSLEGLGMMIPVLDEIIGAAAEEGTRSVLLGMAHRGRLNVLAHILGKPYEQMIGEFLGHYRRENVSTSGSSDEGWTGDVKYHLGARKAYAGGDEVGMLVMLAPNPSHLEWVNPVVEGMTRACDERRNAPGSPRQDELASLAILIHGDASFCGQGIVAETLNLSRLPGYRTGGTIHLIANNQIGFTTPPELGRSTLYASDLAKGFEMPVFHVNADDPEACVAAARLAHSYREQFRKDVILDLVGYRRWGHNEGDEPSFTQPRLYGRIEKHPTVREQWARELVRRGLVTEAETQRMLREAIEGLHAIRRRLAAEGPPPEPAASVSSGREAGGASGGMGRSGAAEVVATAVPVEAARQLNEELYTLPSWFHLHPKLERQFAVRRSLFQAEEQPEGGRRLEWSHAEALAFASVLADGTPVRLTGQDVARGTFSQRHAVLFDAATGKRFVPLGNFPSARASFEVWDSPLSEQATLAFEFGYSLQAPEALVIWEAQYGDFVNVPQAVIDQFVATAKAKWGQYSGLVMLLPHGYEGQGPEHSSARLERFLQLAAEDNLRIANCTTAAQYFHLLRRQMRLLPLDPRPLVLLTPKSLLRHPRAASAASELSEGQFHPLLVDPVRDPQAAERLILCSGKVYYDLILACERSPAYQEGRIAIARLEELYPFPAEEVAALFDALPRLYELVWLQEEPRNMGAWLYVAPRLRDLDQGRFPVVYVGRTRRSSPAEGSHEWHAREQARLVEAALAPDHGREEVPNGAVPPDSAPPDRKRKTAAGSGRMRSSKEVKHAG